MSERSETSAIAPSTESLDSAAKSFESLLSVEDSPPETKRRPKQQAAQDASEAEGEEPEAEGEEGDEGQETAPEEGEEAEEPADEGEEAEGEEPQGKLYTVTVDGKEEKVPLDELLKGYSRTKDYTRKTQALAEERRTFQSEAEQVRTERAQYAQLLPALAMELQNSLPPAPDPALRETDPLQYVLDKDRHEEAKGRLQAAFAELQRVQQAQQIDQVKALEAAVADNFKKLPDLVPAWKDPKAFERDKPKLREYLQKTGYSPEEIDQAYDHRAVAMAWKAMRYDELISRKPRPDTPIEKVLKPQPAAPSAQPPRSQRESRAARERLANSGKVEDAAAAIRALL